MCKLLFYGVTASRILDPFHHSSEDGTADVVLEHGGMIDHLLRSDVVERRVGIRVLEKEEDSLAYLFDVDSWVEVLPEDVEAHVTVGVDIRVVDLGQALHFGSFEGIIGRQVDDEVEMTFTP